MDTKQSNSINPFEFELKTKVKFGIGEFENLNNYLEDFGSKIGIIVDSNVYKSKYIQKILKEQQNIMEYNYGEPTYQLLEKYRHNFDSSYDCLVGIGGGSVIDFTKGLSFLATNKRPALEYRGFPQFCAAPIPIIAIPTTAGTGSEVTYNAVFIDEKEKKKLGINTTLNFPTLAILDPLLIQSCPKSVMISSGLDALTHAIESYGATKSNEITRMFSSKALQLLLNNLTRIKGDATIDVCANLQLGAYLAGAALMNSGSGPAGAMSYILGPNFNVPHGLAGAVFLPHIIEHNEKQGFRYMYGKVADYVFNLCDELDIPYNNLNKLGVTESNVGTLLKGIETLQPAFNQNPTKFTINDAKNIIRGMI